VERWCGREAPGRKRMRRGGTVLREPGAREKMESWDKRVANNKTLKVSNPYYQKRR